VPVDDPLQLVDRGAMRRAIAPEHHGRQAMPVDAVLEVERTAQGKHRAEIERDLNDLDKP